MGIKLDIELLAEIITNEIMKVIYSRINKSHEKLIQNEKLPEKTSMDKKLRVVCFEDIKGIASGVLELEKGTIITPLARDYLRDKKIKITFV